MKNLEIRITNENNGMVTKAFAKQAVIFGTPEFKAWKEFLKEFPNAKMVTKTIKKKGNAPNETEFSLNSIEIYNNKDNQKLKYCALWKKVLKKRWI